jgi:soluble lytic murein transglycosylase-like protein/TolA-binding protein
MGTIKRIISYSLSSLFSLLLLSCFFFDTKRENQVSINVLSEARRAVQEGRYIDAFDLYNILLFFDTSSLEGYSELIALYERFREYPKAANLIVSYRSMSPQNTQFDSILGELYFKMRDYENALAFLKDDSLSSLKKAICYEKTGNLAKSESLYTALAPTFDEISEYLSTRIAYCQVGRGVPESIVDLFRKLGEIVKDSNQKYIIARDLLSHFKKEEKYEEALRLIGIMKLDFPGKESELDLESAHILLAQEKPDDAYALYQRILDEGGAGAYRAGLVLLDSLRLPEKDYMKLAQICYDAGDYWHAKNLLEEVVKVSPTNYTQYLLGMSYYKLNFNNKVVEIFRKLKDTYPEKSQTIIYYLGRAEEKIGDYASAKKTYKKAGIDKKSRLSDNAIYLIALLEEDEGNFDTALEIYKMMMEEFEKGDYVYRAMLRGAILSYRAKKYKDAKEFITKAMKFSKPGQSDHVSGLYWLGRIEGKRGNTAKQDSLWNLIKEKTPLGYFSFYLGGKGLFTEEQDMMKWLSTWTDTVLTLSAEDQIHWRRGVLFLEVGMPAKAQESFDQINQTTIAAYELAKLFRDKGFDYPSITQSLKVKGRSPGSYFSKAPRELLQIEYPLLYLPTILEKCRKYDVEPEIMIALIHQESGYNREAVSVANAIGLTQLLPEVAAEVARNLGIEYHGPEELKSNTDLSIELGVAHFSELQKKYKDYEISLAAYNAGEAKAKEWRKKWAEDLPTYFDMITYSETRGYVKRVLAKREIYKIVWDINTKEYVQSNDDAPAKH